MGWPISHLEVCGALYTTTWSVFRNCDTYPPIWGGRVQAMKRSYGHHWLIHILCPIILYPFVRPKFVHMYFKKKMSTCVPDNEDQKWQEKKTSCRSIASTWSGLLHTPIFWRGHGGGDPCPAEMRDYQVLDARHGQRHDPSTDCYVQDIYPGDSCTTTRRPWTRAFFSERS
jgi:hypothetical protein